MKILFVNNDGGGFADYIELPDGTTVQELFDQKMRGAKAENYLIRVNRQPAARHQVLVEGDRVSMTPTKIEGAWSVARSPFHLAS
jgi:sulfur carrier protein ThiS